MKDDFDKWTAKDARDKKIIVAILVTMTIASTIQSGMLFYEHQQLKAQVTSLEEDISNNAEDTYTLLASDGARLYTIMDTLIRIFHYAKPHKQPAWNCPECSEIHEKAKKNGSVSTANLKKHVKVKK